MCRPKESDVEAIFMEVANRAMLALEVLDPVLTVCIESCGVLGGKADIAVAVQALDEQSQNKYEYQVIIELERPGVALRAANILALGDEPTEGDRAALREPVSSLRDEQLEESLRQLDLFASLPPVKRIASQEGDELEFGYACNGEDVTDLLRLGYLEEPLDSALSSLEKVSRYGSLNGCRIAAISLSEGFTFIGTHLRNVEERQPGLVTANIKSHFAVDLTEDGSSLRILLYFINAAVRD